MGDIKTEIEDSMTDVFEKNLAEQSLKSFCDMKQLRKFYRMKVSQ